MAEPFRLGEDAAFAIRELQTSDATVWEHQRLAQILYPIGDRLMSDFALRIPQPVILFKELPRRTVATYGLVRERSLGTQSTITFNTRYLSRPLEDILATWFHELRHCWDQWQNDRHSGGWYHSKAWRDKLEEVGIIADERGQHLEVLPRFHKYLRQLGLRAVAPDYPPGALIAARPARQRSMPKWVCRCPKPTSEPRRRSQAGNPVRAIYLNATCRDCGQVYRQADGD